jgi:hypothetical protein
MRWQSQSKALRKRMPGNFLLCNKNEAAVRGDFTMPNAEHRGLSMNRGDGQWIHFQAAG